MGLMRGIPTKLRFMCATIFADQLSGFSYVHPQLSTNAEETLEAKEAFERFGSRYGVKIMHYHADNGIFADNKWRQATAEDEQTLCLCGVNAHWQNGVAKLQIRELSNHARMMLIHAHRLWPSAIEANLWPYALRMANDLHNKLPTTSGDPPPINFYTSRQHHFKPIDWHHFGAPTYVLANQLQSGNAYPKWSERARIGIYLGQSPQHARSVSLVLSLQSVCVSPQFHCVVDGSFETTQPMLHQEPLPESLWQEKCHFKCVTRSSRHVTPAEEAAALPDVSGDLDPSLLDSDVPAQSIDDGQTHMLASAYKMNRPAVDASADRLQPEYRYPKRARFAPDIWTYSAEAKTGHLDPLQFLDDVFCKKATLHCFMSQKESSSDTLYLHQALKEPDRKEFIGAMDVEVQDQVKLGQYVIRHKSTLPEGAIILPCVWNMRRKHQLWSCKIYK